MPPSTRLSKAGVALSIEKSFTINDSAGSPNMYVFDYTGDGFAVFSADERYNPVLAVVPNGKYEQCKNQFGITNWFGETMDYINLAKKAFLILKTILQQGGGMLLTRLINPLRLPAPEA